MSGIRNYLTFAYHEFLFDAGYKILQKNPEDREVLVLTFDEGRKALWALEDMSIEDQNSSKNKDLASRVHQLSKQIKELTLNYSS